jgi:hypothetical protein
LSVDDSVVTLLSSAPADHADGALRRAMRDDVEIGSSELDDDSDSFYSDEERPNNSGSRFKVCGHLVSLDR